MHLSPSFRPIGYWITRLLARSRFSHSLILHAPILPPRLSPRPGPNPPSSLPPETLTVLAGPAEDGLAPGPGAGGRVALHAHLVGRVRHQVAKSGARATHLQRQRHGHPVGRADVADRVAPQDSVPAGEG